MLMYEFYIGWYQPTNGAIANVVHRDMNYICKVTKFLSLYIQNLLNNESYRKMLKCDFYAGW